MKNNIQTFKLDTQGLKKTINENPPTQIFFKGWSHPGLNPGPLDPQSSALPTQLRRLKDFGLKNFSIYISISTRFYQLKSCNAQWTTKQSLHRNFEVHQYKGIYLQMLKHKHQGEWNPQNQYNQILYQGSSNNYIDRMRQVKTD